MNIGRNLPKTDIQHADDVGLAAVHLLLIQWHDDKSQLPLFRAFACLRYIISKSPNAAHAKYLLTRLARMLGQYLNRPFTSSQTSTYTARCVASYTRWDVWFDRIRRGAIRYSHSCPR